MAGELGTYIGAEIPALAEELRDKFNEAYQQDVPFETLVNWLSDFSSTVFKEHLQLSRTHPDFESIKQQFIARLRTSPAWKDIIQAAGGETILEFIAAVGDYGQTSILRAYQDNAYDSARLVSSIYRLTRTLGVHIDRRIPAQVKVSLFGENIGNVSIPRLSQFTIGGMPFFNRQTIMLDNSNTEANPKIATLYQGAIEMESFTSNGAPFQTFEIGLNDYSLANEDIYCFTNANEQYERVTDGLWHYRRSEKVFNENTTPLGNVEIALGNGVFGHLPIVDRNMHFIYATTIGSGANSTNVGQEVGIVELNDFVPDRIKRTTTQLEDAEKRRITETIRGLTVSAIHSGDMEKDKEFYRAVAPGIRSARKRMNTRRDHYSLGLLFPGLADVYFQGQRELGRHDRNLINVSSITALKRDGTLMTQLEWDAYTAYLDELQIWRVNWIRIDPTPVPIKIVASVFCAPGTDTTNVGSFIKHQLSQFLRIQRGSLGRSIYRNDIEDRMKFKYGGMIVDYAIVQQPLLDTIVTKTQYPVLVEEPSISVNYSTRGYMSIPPRIIS